MATRKIGALIALDGEKKFRQDISSCNKSLNEMKSEMKLLSEESDGNANTLESLRKKHELLGRTLEANQEKEKTISKALENAKVNYKRAGDTLEEYRTKLQQATSRLDEMKASSDTTESELEEQEKTVAKLAETVKKGETSYKNCEQKITTWTIQLNNAKTETLKAGKELEKYADYIDEAKKNTDKCTHSIDEHGKATKGASKETEDFGNATEKTTKISLSFSEILKNNLVNDAINLLQDGLKKTVGLMTDMESAEHQLQAATGLTNQEMGEYKTIMDTLFDKNIGDDINDVATAMEKVKQYTNEVDPEKLGRTTENAIALRDVFDMDLSESLRGADALMRNMGLTSQEAFDLMTKGAQNGLNKSDELGDNIAEYSQLWAQAGFTAQEMFAITDNGLKSGAYNLDKVNDFVKEFTISLSDGRIAENISSFSGSTQVLFQNWQNGKATAKDVFYSVIHDLETAENKQEALTLASSTWSALGEDNALKVITALNDTNDAYVNVQGTMDQMKHVKYDTLESRIRSLGKTAMTEIGKPVAEKLLPKLEKGLDEVAKHTDMIIPAAKGVIGAVAGFKTASVALEIYGKRTEIASVAQGALNLAMNANPAILLATAVGTATVALMTYYKSTHETTNESLELVKETNNLQEEMESLSAGMESTKQQWTDTTANITAQETASKNLVTELYNLEAQSNKTNGEKERMYTIVGELNEMYPDLLLAIDDETGKLNKNKEAVEQNIDASIAYSKAKAAQKQLTDIAEDLVDAELAKYKAEQQNLKIGNKLKDLDKQRKKIIEDVTEKNVEYNGVMYDQQTALQMIQTDEDLLQAERQETEKSIESLKENYDSLNEQYGIVSEYSQEQIDKNKEISGTLEEIENSSNQTAATEVANAEVITNAMQETYTEAVETVNGVLTSQMDMFAEFDAGTQLSTTELLNNMQSQIDGVTNWSTNIGILADRGINQNLLQYLVDMGPAGAGYVATFAGMTDTELQEANHKWEKSMDMKSGVEKTVSGMLNKYVSALHGGQGSVSQGYKDVVNAGVTGLQIQSTSRRPDVATVGESVPTNLAGGISSASGKVTMATNQVAAGSVSTARESLNKATFQSIGLNVSEGMAEGISSGKSKVIDATRAMCNAAIGTSRNTLQINSPSKEFIWQGEMSDEGYAQGVANKTYLVKDAMRSMMEIPKSEKSGFGYNSNRSGKINTAAIDYDQLGAVFEKVVNKLLNGVEVNIGMNGRKVGQRIRERGVSY